MGKYLHNYKSHTTKSFGGGGGILVSLHPSLCPSVHPSIRPASRIRSVAPTVLVGSISYLYISSSNFRMCVTCKSWLFGNFLNFCNFDFVLFWLGIWCESLVWLIMGRREVSQNTGVLVGLVQFSFSCDHLSVPRYLISALTDILLSVFQVSSEVDYVSVDWQGCLWLWIIHNSVLPWRK